MRSVPCSHPCDLGGGDLKDFLMHSSSEHLHQTTCFFFFKNSFCDCFMPLGGSNSLFLVTFELFVCGLYNPRGTPKIIDLRVKTSSHMSMIIYSDFSNIPFY